MRKSILAGLIPTVALAVTLTACQDTKARQENDQLRSQVAELQKENTELNTRVDSLTKDNAELKDEKGQPVQSEKMMEIDFQGGRPVRTGDQFGLGRMADHEEKTTTK